MTQRTAIQTPQQVQTTTTPTSGILQRQCTCGNHTVAGGECAECRQKQLQRKATGHTKPEAVPPIVPAVLHSPGQRLDAGTQAFREPRFGRDFSRIPTHPPAAGVIQTKLAINKPGDEYEQEADRIADQVMATPVHQPLSGAPPRIQRFAGQPTGQIDAAPASVDQALASPGRPLEPALRQDMEQRFGHDFSRVRVHTDTRAAESARAVNARAYTVGRHVVFASGKYAPHTLDGKRLLTHELAHTLQQRNAPAGSTRLRVTAPNDSHETEADRITRDVSRDVAPERSAPGERAAPLSVAPTGAQIARQPAANPEPANAAPGGTPHQRLETAMKLLRKWGSTDRTITYLHEQGIQLELRSGSASFYDPNPKARKIILNADSSGAQMAQDLAFEARKIQIDTRKKDIRRDLGIKAYEKEMYRRGQGVGDSSLYEKYEPKTHEAYVGDKLSTVAEAASDVIEFNRGLRRQGLATDPAPLESEYDLAYHLEYNKHYVRKLVESGSTNVADNYANEKGSAAGRQAVAEAITSDKLLTGDTREKYADQFGKEWEAKQAERAKQEEELAKVRAEAKIEAERQAKIEAGRKALVELVNVVVPNSPQADSVIQLVYLFTVQHGGAQTMFLIGAAREGLVRLLGRYGFKDFEEVGSAVMERARLEYALFNFLGLTQPQRNRLRNPDFADLYEYRHWQAITYEEIQARENQPVNLRLPDGTPFQGTRAEYREASHRNVVNHALAQLNQIRSAGPISLIGRIVYGEKGAAIGGLFDAVLPVASGMRARQAVRTEMSKLSSGGGGPVGPTPLQPPAIRAPAPPRIAVPKPGRPAPPPAAPGPTVVKPAPPGAPGQTIIPPKPTTPLAPSRPMRAPPGGGPRAGMTGTGKTSMPHSQSTPTVEVLPRGTVPMADFEPAPAGHYIVRKPPSAETQRQVLARAGRTTDGRLRDANTGRALDDGEAVWGHAPYYQFAKMRDMAERLGWTQAQFDAFFENPAFWQIEYGPSNSGRVFDRIPRQRPVH